MTDFQFPKWLKYSLALVVVVLLGAISGIPDLEFPSPQDVGWSPLVGLIHAVVVGAAFGLLLFTATIWLNRPQGSPRKSLRRGVFAFFLFAGGDFAIELLTRPFFSGLSAHVVLQQALVRLVQAGRGWLLPMIFLTVFVAVILLKRRRAG